jgi:hypothetical protein
MKITWLEKNDLMATAMRAMQPVEVVMDIGCGIVPQSFVKPQVHICCEPYTEYVVHLQKKISGMDERDRSYVVLNMGWGEAVRYFPEKSVDTIFLVDVIEHLEKEEGHALLALTEKIARRQLVIFTPLGFMPQHHADGKDGWGLSGADWQEHKSGWMPNDFVGEEWEFFAAREFHAVDSAGKPISQSFGAFWAIKTYRSSKKKALMEREMALHMREADFKQQQAVLLQKEEEINTLLSARVERKIRRALKGMFSK